MPWFSMIIESRIIVCEQYAFKPRKGFISSSLSSQTSHPTDHLYLLEIKTGWADQKVKKRYFTLYRFIYSL